MKLEFIVESILLVSQHPLSARKLASAVGKPLNEVREAIVELSMHYASQNRGIVLLQNNNEYQIATHPDAAAAVRKYVSEEVIGELTRPALETLSVISYRGPVRKSEIEKIRGVNCSLALRNLLIRGLIEESDLARADEKIYVLSMEFLRHLGVKETRELPDYERLHSDDILAGL